jgi:predicted DNA-binding transcriptional regulator YafY
MSAPELLREKFKPPVDFKLDDYLAGSMGVMRGTGDYEVILEFDAWATDLIKHRRWHPSQRLHLLGSGSRLTLRLNNLEEVHRWALSWGQHVTVIAPDLLRARMLESAQALIERYGDPERPRVIEPMFSLADTPRFGVS